MQLFIILLVSLILNIIIGYHASYKRNIKEGENVYDIGFDALPNLEKYHKLGDYILIVPFLFVLFSWNSWTRTKKGNYLSMLILMFSFRALSNYVTTIPSSKECLLKPPFGFCNDYIFSGHSAFNIVSSYHIGSPLWPIWPAVTSLFSIASREHYSVDVVIAWIIFAAMKSKL